MEHNMLIVHGNITEQFERRGGISGPWKLQEGIVELNVISVRDNGALERRNCPADRVPEERG